jgi:DNA-binding MarR family transcriptional regulator
MNPTDYFSRMRGTSKSTAARSRARPDAPEEKWLRYRGNVARHLIGISRDLESRVVRSLDEDGGYQGLRPSFGPLLSLLWDEGQPLTAIADELAISKQACSQLANLVQEAGYVERMPNPQDRRSKVVSLTERGRSLVEEGVRLILEIEFEYKTLLGATVYRQFIWALADLYRGLGLPMNTDPALAAKASQSVGVLPLIGVRVQRELMKATIARGHPGLKMSHGQVLPLIGDEGGRIFEIARIQGVSRQAISMISQDLEGLGYLRREPDPRDRRGVVFRLTPRGETLIADSVAAVDGLESSFNKILGEKVLSHLKRAARELYAALRLEEEIFESSSDAKSDSSRLASSPPLKRSPSKVPSSRAIRETDEIQRLAAKLRRELGNGDVARLAALLES